MKNPDAMDRLLRRSHRAFDENARESQCLDAETIAAWQSGALQAGRRMAVDAHVADCSRCLAVVAALVQTEPEAETRRARRWLPLGWLVPMAAAATAAFLLVLVERAPDRPAVPDAAREQFAAAPETPAVSAERPASPAAPETAPLGERRTVTGPSPAVSPRPEAGRDAARLEAETAGAARRLDAPVVAQPSAAPQEGAPATADAREREESIALTAPPSAQAEAADPSAARFRSAVPRAPDTPVEVSTPDPAVRWRVLGTAVTRSVDGGATWQRQTDAPAPLLSVAAPSPTVCWVAGASGTVLRTTDGSTWAAVAFPERVDLIAITASDARTATVTAADGRIFHTADGGLSWSLQESPATPF